MKRRLGTNLLLALVVLLAAASLLGACGRDKKEGTGEISGTTTTIGLVNTGGAPVIGFTECYKCHADDNNPASFPFVFGDTGVNIAAAIGWLNGPHGNNETYNETTHAQTDNRPMNPGFPFYDYFSDSTCAQCHDPLNEGTSIEAFFTGSGDDALGMVNRPVVGCEACHGGGGNHFAVGPMPFPKPDQDRCGQCHNDSFPDSHLGFHPEGDRIVEDYKASKHASSINEHTYATEGDPSMIRARCSRCHTDQGARLYVPVTSGTSTYNDITTATANLPNITNASAVQCRTCHDGHNPTNLLGEEDAVAPGTWSEEFKTCTQCHQLLKADGSLNDQVYHTPTDKAGTTINAFGSFEEIIGDTHYDDPATASTIEGYVVSPASGHSGAAKNRNQGVCRDCHNPHKADNTINRQWARSAHAGEILEIKEAASNPYTAGVTTYTTDAELSKIAAAFTNYDFKGASRVACQRCHTSTGFRNFANDPTTYNAATNTFVASGNQKEMIYCWACHTDNVGGLRNPGFFGRPNYVTGTANVQNGSTTVQGNGTVWNSDNTPVGSELIVAGDTISYIVSAVDTTNQVITLTAAYGGSTANGVGYEASPYIVPSGRTIANASGSFVCASCHSGRETGEYIRSYPAAIAGKNFGTFNSHYLTAGGILYRTIGYEYSGLSYSNPSTFAHDTIGVSATNTGTNGPCVECHMSTTDSHLFLPTTRDQATGAVTAIAASAVCETCHGTAMTADALNTLDAQYEAALDALVAQLAAGGIYYNKSVYPYFHNVSTNQTRNTGYTAWANKDILGAAFNLNVFKHQPAAYVHNSMYTRRLIYDSIDFADDATLNNSVSTAITNLVAAGSLTTTQQADASGFLGNGTRP